VSSRFQERRQLLVGPVLCDPCLGLEASCQGGKGKIAVDALQDACERAATGALAVREQDAG
jgi:hypothetical protein